MLKSFGKKVFVKPESEPLSLIPEQQHILDSEPGDVAYQKFVEMGLTDLIIAEEFYDDRRSVLDKPEPEAPIPRCDEDTAPVQCKRPITPIRESEQ